MDEQSVTQKILFTDGKKGTLIPPGAGGLGNMTVSDVSQMQATHWDPPVKWVLLLHTPQPSKLNNISYLCGEWLMADCSVKNSCRFSNLSLQFYNPVIQSGYTLWTCRSLWSGYQIWILSSGIPFRTLFIFKKEKLNFLQVELVENYQSCTLWLNTGGLIWERPHMCECEHSVMLSTAEGSATQRPVVGTSPLVRPQQGVKQTTAGSQTDI